MADTVIHAEGLGKKYLIGHRTLRDSFTLRDAVARGARTAWRKASDLAHGRPIIAGDTLEEVWALRDVGFEVGRGEIVGIIGRNGAGKSTLLKILSQITEPTTGRVRIEGRLGSLLEVGTGFHSELTGRENIFLNGAILGMTRAEIRSRFDAIVDFAEVGTFLDTPVKRYSSGMYVRLAFAVAAHLEPDILVIDEVLAVGDVGFQRKCLDYTRRLAGRGVTVLLVSHNMFAIKTLCRRAILLGAGQVRFDGAADGAIELYSRESTLDTDPWAVSVIGEDPQAWPVVIQKVETLSDGGEPRAIYDHGERLRVRIHYAVRRPVRSPNFCVGIRRSDNVFCCSYSAARDGVTVPWLTESGVMEVTTPPLRLVSELYGITVGIWDDGFKTLYCGHIGPNFHVRDETLDPEFGVFSEPAEWRWESGPDADPGGRPR
jgi:lipopolysaccharide transport system ATP-binding protein